MVKCQWWLLGNKPELMHVLDVGVTKTLHVYLNNNEFFGWIFCVGEHFAETQRDATLRRLAAVWTKVIQFWKKSKIYLISCTKSFTSLRLDSGYGFNIWSWSMRCQRSVQGSHARTQPWMLRRRFGCSPCLKVSLLKSNTGSVFRSILCSPGVFTCGPVQKTRPRQNRLP